MSKYVKAAKAKRARTIPLVGAIAGLALGMIAILSASIGHEQAAHAIASCGDPGVSGEEAQLLSLIGNLRSGGQVERSSALDAAAQGYADYLAGHYEANGHNADGSNWNYRAAQCGYPEEWAGGGGESVWAQTAGTGAIGFDVSPAEAIAGMQQYSRGAIDMPMGRCAGVGKAIKRDNSGAVIKVAWVAVVFMGPATGPCPSSNSLEETPTSSVTSAASPSPSGTPTKTSTPTATPTKTSTPTPSPTATPGPRYNTQITLTPGQWNLVTLPAGPLNDVLARMHGCYEAVYQLRDGAWQRYSADVPLYARSMLTSNGGAFWIKASAKNCGAISL